jgi:hypothetical protein
LVKHDAKPVEVKDEVSLNLNGYKPVSAKSEESGTGVEKVSQTSKDPLVEEFISVINELGKKSSKDFSINRQPVVNFFNELERDANLGRDFIKHLIGVTKEAQQKQEIIERLKTSFGSEFMAMASYAEQEYKKQARAIKEKKEDAQAQALAKQMQAQTS